jgi:hypothetical protein
LAGPEKTSLLASRRRERSSQPSSGKANRRSFKPERRPPAAQISRSSTMSLLNSASDHLKVAAPADFDLIWGNPWSLPFVQLLVLLSFTSKTSKQPNKSCYFLLCYFFLLLCYILSYSLFNTKNILSSCTLIYN